MVLGGTEKGGKRERIQSFWLYHLKAKEKQAFLGSADEWKKQVQIIKQQ